jgi:hypothetical protein
MNTTYRKFYNLSLDFNPVRIQNLVTWMLKGKPLWFDFPEFVSKFANSRCRSFELQNWMYEISSPPDSLIIVKRGNKCGMWEWHENTSANWFYFLKICV